MKKLLQLLNEYEESRWSIVAEDSEEYQAAPTRLEYDGHVRHINANKVAYEKDTFDAYILSKKYGFIRWLLENGYIIPYTAVYSPIEGRTIGFTNGVTVTTVNDSIFDSLTAYLATSNNPISDLINLLS